MMVAARSIAADKSKIPKLMAPQAVTNLLRKTPKNPLVVSEVSTKDKITNQ